MLLKSKTAGDWVKAAAESPEGAREELAKNHIAARGARKRNVAAWENHELRQQPPDGAGPTFTFLEEYLQPLPPLSDKRVHVSPNILPAHLTPAHGHGVDATKDLLRRDRIFRTEFLRAVFADE